MFSGFVVEFDLIRFKVREDDGGFWYFFYFCYGVNLLRGWREAVLGCFGVNGILEVFLLEFGLFYGCSRVIKFFFWGDVVF